MVKSKHLSKVCLLTKLKLPKHFMIVNYHPVGYNNPVMRGQFLGKLASLMRPWIWVMIFGGFCLIRPEFVRADNTDSSLPQCDITVAGKKFTPNSSNTIAYYSSKQENQYYYDVKVCGVEKTYVDECLAGGASVKMTIGWPLGWSNPELTPQGNCFVGQIKNSEWGGTDVNNIFLDTKLNAGGNSCGDGAPLCQRAYGKLSSQQGASDADGCSAALKKLNTNCGLTFSTQKFVKGLPIDMTLTVDPILADTCAGGPLKNITAYVQDPNNNVITGAGVCMAGSSDCSVSQACNGGKFGSCDFSFTPTMIASCNGSSGYKIIVSRLTNDGTTKNCTVNFGVGADTASACDAPDPVDATQIPFRICDQIKNDPNSSAPSSAYQKCLDCMGGSDSTEVKGVWTAVGCIKTEPQSIITTVIKIGLSVAGGAALLMILAASFIISTSAGDAKKFTEGKEMISNAVIGLVFIILSITVLQFIGVTLFHIPGFGE